MTTSPDVTVSTNLGPWVNRRGVFDRHTRNDVFRDSKLASAQRWGMAPGGQHIELGIAEQNLFLLLAAAGLQHSLNVSGDPLDLIVIRKGSTGETDGGFDADKAQAIATRQRILGRVADERISMLGYHMPFPAAGFVERDGEGFRWVPVSYQFTS